MHTGVFRAEFFGPMKKDTASDVIRIDDIRAVRLIVNDRKFPARTVFFSHTKPASSNNPRSYTIVSAPAEQAELIDTDHFYIDDR